jgi:hypothetical protein
VVREESEASEKVKFTKVNKRYTRNTKDLQNSCVVLKTRMWENYTGFGDPLLVDTTTTRCVVQLSIVCDVRSRRF